MNKFIRSIEKRNIDSKLKNVPEIKPSLNSVKINTIRRYLEGSRRIITDNDDHIIIWIRQHNADQLRLLK
jgi:hypothetical protein